MRFPIRKTLPTDNGELRLSPTLASIFAAPAPNEDAALDAVAKAGGAEDVQEVTAAMLRARSALVQAYGGRLPAELRKAMADVVPGVGDEDDDEDEDSYLDPTMDDGTDENDEPPSIKTKKKKKAASGTVGKALGIGELSKEEAASLLDSIRDVLPEWKADELQKSDPSMTRAQALAKAYTDDPSLWERQQKAQAARVEKAAADQSARRIEGEKKLADLAEEIRKSDPSLTKPQAFVKALERHPDWYVSDPYTYVPTESVVEKAERDAANEKLEQIAKRHRERDPSLTHAQAFTLALKQNPDLYRG